MPNATLSLTRASIIWRRGHATRLTGYGVLSAVAYDGVEGILPPNPAPPIHFKRRPRRGYDLIAPTAPGVGDDGLLIASFSDVPNALGWGITLTLTESLEQAKKIGEVATKAAEGVLDSIPGSSMLGGLAKVLGAISDAAAGIGGPRNVGTWIGSESDADDLHRDWRLAHEHFKTRFELEYDVKADGDADD